MHLNILNSKEEVAQKLASELYQHILNLHKERITIAISGGTTPYLLFEVWVKEYNKKVPWEKIHFFWVDERCVNPDDIESNFGNTKKVLFDYIEIPHSNIHRVLGENNPEAEAIRYADEIKKWVEIKEDLPRFDIVLLGMGDDGHTASVFPPSKDLLTSPSWVAATQNPYNHQPRITLTGKVINNSAGVYFMVTGKSKAAVLKQVIQQTGNFQEYPASFIESINGNLHWFIDADAASLL